MATITEEVRRFITQNYLLGQGRVVGDSDSFLDHGILDSTGVLELVAFLEETYGISVEDEELVPDNLDSIASIAAYVLRKQSGGAQASVATLESARQGRSI